MSTPNFKPCNSSKIFAIMDHYNTAEDVEYYREEYGWNFEEGAYNADLTEIDQEDGQLNIQADLEALGYTAGLTCGDIASVTRSICFAGREIALQFQVTMEPAYFEGLQFDWNFTAVDSWGLNFDPQDIDELAGAIDPYNDRPGLARMLAPKLAKRLAQMIETETAQIENILAQYCSQFACIGIASNGEGFYRKIA